MLEAIGAGYRTGAPGNTWLLRGLDLEAGIGEFVAILGPNGAGKTTALRLLSGEWVPSEGEVRLMGTRLWDETPQALARKRACFAQHTGGAFPFTVREMAALGRLPHGQGLQESERDRLIVDRALERADVFSLAGRSFPTLSGGEATRTHFARALAQEPALLLLDEPTNHLDVRHQYDVLRECRRLTEHGCAVVAVLHDLNLASQFADQIVMLSQGRVVATGAPGDVLTPLLIEDVYGIPCAVWTHPSGCPWIVPTLERTAVSAAHAVSA